MQGRLGLPRPTLDARCADPTPITVMPDPDPASIGGGENEPLTSLSAATDNSSGSSPLLSG